MDEIDSKLKDKQLDWDPKTFGFNLLNFSHKLDSEHILVDSLWKRKFRNFQYSPKREKMLPWSRKLNIFFWELNILNGTAKPKIVCIYHFLSIHEHKNLVRDESYSIFCLKKRKRKKNIVKFFPQNPYWFFL